MSSGSFAASARCVFLFAGQRETVAGSYVTMEGKYKAVPDLETTVGVR
jgi:hypothetical protein